MNRNIFLFYFYKIFSGMFFAVPVLVLFWQDNGLSLTQIMILQSLFAVATVILEVPSGYFSDYYGRRKTLIVASVSGTAAIGLYGLGSSFWHFLGAEMLFALNVSFVSGTASALVYETLLEEGREGEYKKIWGHAFFLGTMALALSNVLGGVIGEFRLRYTIYASFPFFLAAVPLSILLREPERKRKNVEDGHRKELLAIAMKIVTHKRLGGIIFYSGVIFAFNQSVLWLYQPYFKLSPHGVLRICIQFSLLSAAAIRQGIQEHGHHGLHKQDRPSRIEGYRLVR